MCGVNEPIGLYVSAAYAKSTPVLSPTARYRESGENATASAVPPNCNLVCGRVSSGLRRSAAGIMSIFLCKRHGVQIVSASTSVFAG